MSESLTPPPPDKVDEPEGALAEIKALVPESVGRRDVLKLGAMGAFFTVGSAVGVTPLLNIKSDVTLSSFLQQHYSRLTPKRMKKILERLERETEKRHGVENPSIQDIRPLPDVQFAYTLNMGRCIGCRRCVYACVKENNQSRDPQVHYIRVLEMPQGSLDVEASEHYYDHEEVPAKNKFYMPVQCQQCEKPACVKACPIKATWQEEDGIVVVDYNWCIGCRYCEAACPYYARRFNFAEPKIPAGEANPEMAYLGNRIRPMGVMEKCTFCLRRTRQGMYPACVEVCPVGARQFGNVLDPNSQVRYILENKRVYILKNDLGTHPRFYYWFDK
jgi:Fe-S-cluster-containing dehydrogenase component